MTESYIASSLPGYEVAELHRLMTEEIREVAVFFMTPEGIITVWNRAAEDMKGYTAEEAIGQHLRMLYTDEDVARGWPEHNLNEAAKLGFYKEENWRKHKDGHLFWARISLTALHNDAGVLVGFSKITLDLTQHKMLEACEKEKDEATRILKAAQAGTWKWNMTSNQVEVSPHFLGLLGHESVEKTLSFDQWLKFIHPEDRREVSRQLLGARIRSHNFPFVNQMRMQLSNGEFRWFFVRADWYRENEDDELVLWGVNVDIHSLKTSQDEREALFHQLEGEKERVLVTLSAITDGVITAGLDGDIFSINPAAQVMIGSTETEVIGQSIQDVFGELDEATQALTLKPLKHCIAEKKTIRGRHNAKLLNKLGQEYSVETTASPILLADNTLIGAVLVMHDVSRSRKLLNRLNFQATHDALTGLINRMEFEKRLKRALDKAKPLYGPGSALLYMDLDQFKVVNDTCGHTEGDELLRQLAHVYRAHMRERDTLARIGGDEFALIIEHCSLEEAITIAEKILEATRNFRYICKGFVFQISVSIGLIAINANASTVENVLREADHACYLAKESGRNQVYVQQSYDVDIAQRRNDMHWVRRLDEAFHNDKLQLHYQPIVPIGNANGALHYEILLRLVDDNNALVGPNIFLPPAERYDVMPSIDRWVLKNTLKWLGENPEHVESLDICTINLSRRTLADESFQKYAKQLFDSTTVPANKICFEITENGAIANMNKTVSFIESLADRGCKFSLDDFGTGMTSFSYLKQLPVDFIKIDGSFIQMMGSSKIDYEMVRFTNDISHMMGRQTIAEHVTTPLILKNLEDIGVDFAQGYWLGEPKPLIN